MSVTSDLKSALAPIGYDVAMDIYDGTNNKYFVYNLDTDEAGLAWDDTVKTEITHVKVHFYAPKNFNYISTIKTAKKNLETQGFSFPTTSLNTVEKDTLIRHICLETQIEKEC